MPFNIKSKIVKEYVLKYPELPNKTLARVIYKNEPLTFNNLEEVRKSVIYYRQKMNIKTPIRTFKDGIKNDFQEVKINGNHRVLILSDIHIPFHNKNILLQIFKDIKEYDILILNGDILDAYTLSNFVREPSQRYFADELKIAEDMFNYIRQKNKKIRILYKYGNHEERYERFLFHKAPELFGISEYELKVILHLDKYGIEAIDNKRAIILNELYVLHGHEYGNSSYTAVNPARTIYLKTKKNTLVGHYHQPSTHQEPSIDNKFITCWSTGCLCDLHPKYRPYNKWALGYATVETYGKKEFNVNNYKFINNKIFNT